MMISQLEDHHLVFTQAAVQLVAWYHIFEYTRSGTCFNIHIAEYGESALDLNAVVFSWYLRKYCLNCHWYVINLSGLL